MKKQRVAILGGTFNPIHNGHLALARGFADLLQLDRVLLMVTNVPPHKSAPDLATGQERFAMCALAAQADPRLCPSDLELNRFGKSYTWETLSELHRQLPDAELFFITGADMFLTLEEWKHPERIFDLCTVCAAPRGEQSAQQLHSYANKLNQRGAKTVIANFIPPEISSTQVRQLVAQGISPNHLVPKEVCDYIFERRLYAPVTGGLQQ